MINNVFYLHTPQRIKGLQKQMRATIACSIVGSAIKYGISICSDDDNFNRAKGRELATLRMNESFGYIPRDKGVYGSMKDDEAVLSLLATQMAKAIMRNTPRYKRKLEQFNQTTKALSKRVI